ncbi:MAG TPA: dienelactone hydrolase family protein [Kiloniellales bacterium]|nr:dienelactone hydrolase family protein [Kiloniellales bacterium]
MLRLTLLCLALLFATPLHADLLQKPNLAAEGQWKLYLKLPEGPGPYPLVVFLPGCAGWSSWERHSADRHRQALAEQGWGIAELDVLGARGIDSICTDDALLEGMRDDAVLAASEAAAALGARDDVDESRIVFMGQSFGGSVALDIASVHRRQLAGAERVFAAVIPYYPYCYDRYGMGTAADFDTPVLVLGGELDTWTPVSRCVALAEAQAARENPAPFVVEIYPGAYHSFDLDLMPRYEIAGYKGLEVVQGNEAQAKASRARYMEWLAETVP